MIFRFEMLAYLSLSLYRLLVWFLGGGGKEGIVIVIIEKISIRSLDGRGMDIEA